MFTCIHCGLDRAEHLKSKKRVNVCAWCTGEEVHLKPDLSLGTRRNFDNCMHLEEGKTSNEGKCLLYNCKKCIDINHRKFEECIFLDKTQFIWGDKTWEKILKSYFELFLGEPVEPIIMDTGRKKITIPVKQKSKQLLTKKERKKIKLGKNLSDLLKPESVSSII